jgi:murein DD-endopeptidase MepM/ murein hydrolase activator NlpD
VLKHRLGSPEKIRVGDVLIQKRLITTDELTQALLEQRNTKAKLGEILVQRGLLTHQELRAALNEQRWRNWIAAFLLSLGSLATVAPKLATAMPMRIETSSAETGQTFSSKTVARNFTSESQSYPPLAANPNPTIASPLQGFCHPLNGLGYVSQAIRSTTHQGRMEYAYDLAASIGTPVYAMRAGRVIGIQDRYPDTGGGAENISKFNYLLIEHDGGYRSAYLHLKQGFHSQVQIKAGDRVEVGQLIGYSGNSGWSSGPHLHIELEEPGDAYSFGQTVPFAIAGTCKPNTVATVKHYRLDRLCIESWKH